jgi:hypothetical protein
MDLVNYACKSQIKYSEVMPELIKLVDNGSVSECKQVIDSLKDIISDKKCSPSQKTLALDLFQACMLLNKSDFIQTAESRILSTLVKLATKSPVILFHDSIETKAKEQDSERFLNKLLNFIYIWANEFTYESGKTSEFTKAFYKLREIVKFPDRKIRSNSRSATIPPTPVSSDRPKEKITLKYILGMLEVVESMPEPRSSEAGVELLNSLEQVVPNLEETLKVAMNSNDKSIKDRVLKVMNRVNKVLGRPEFNYRNSVPAPLNTSFLNEITGIDLGLDSKTNREYLGSFSAMKTSSIHSSNSFIEKSSNSFVFPDPGDSAELEKMRKILQSKNEYLLQLEQKNLILQAQVKSLEENLEKYKEMFASKELECQNLMSIMNQHANKMVKKQETFKEGFFEEKQENHLELNDFRMSLCDRHKILLENSYVLITFDGTLKGNAYQLVLKVLNVTDSIIRNLDFEVESAFGFDVKFSSSEQKVVQALGEATKELVVQNLCVTDTIPVVSVKFLQEKQEFSFSFRIPVNICRFAQVFTLQTQDLWNEFELLAFDNDNSLVFCSFSFKKCKRLMRLSQHAKIFTNSNLNGLSDNQILVCFEMSKRVYILVTVKTIHQQATIEIRSELLSIRKSLMILISNQLK